MVVSLITTQRSWVQTLVPVKTLFLIEEDGVQVSGQINGTVSQTWSGSKVEEIFLIFLMMQLKNILTFGGGSILRGRTLTSTHQDFGPLHPCLHYGQIHSAKITQLPLLCMHLGNPLPLSVWISFKYGP